MEIKIRGINSPYYFASLNQACDDHYNRTQYNGINLYTLQHKQLVINKNIKRKIQYFYYYHIWITIARKGIIRHGSKGDPAIIVFNPDLPIEESCKRMFSIHKINNNINKQFTVGIAIPYRNKALAIAIAKAKLKMYLEKEKISAENF